MEGGLQVWIRITWSLPWLASFCGSSWLWLVLGDCFALVMVWETFLTVPELITARQAVSATLCLSLSQPTGIVPAHMSLPQAAWQGFPGPTSCQ